MLSEIFIGLFVFILGQFLILFVFRPMKAVKDAIAESANQLTYYANVYMNASMASDEDIKVMSETIRRQATQLRSLVDVPRFYGTFRWVFGLPAKAVVRKSTKWMIGISNITGASVKDDFMYPQQLRDNVSKSLGLDLRG